MALPSETDVAGRAGIPANDPRAADALAVALSWARDRLSRAVDDTLDDLTDSGNEAVLGYAVDASRLPKIHEALATPENGDVGLFEIGVRWEPLLCRGNKHQWGIR